MRLAGMRQRLPHAACRMPETIFPKLPGNLGTIALKHVLSELEADENAQSHSDGAQ